MDLILDLYHWFWHDLLGLKEPISWIIVHSMRDHLLVWQLGGSVVCSVLWTLICHFIAML